MTPIAAVPCRPARLRALFGVLALLALLVSPPGAVRSAPARDAMAAAMGEMMLRMMETMGMLESAPPATWPAPGMAGWPSAFGAWPAPGAAPGGPADGGQAPVSGMPLTDGAAALEGIWEGSDQTLLIVQRGHYRLYATLADHLDGEAQVSGDRLTLTNQRENFSRIFEYALDQGRLALRDRNGQVYLYRRLELGGAGQAPR